MPTLSTYPDVTAPIQLVLDWLALPTTKERIQAAVSEGVAEADRYVLSNLGRIPRQREERRDGFRLWLDAFAAHGFDHLLNSYKRQIAQDIQREMLLAFPEVLSGLQNRELIRETIETLIWPEMEPILRDRAEELLLTYVIRAIALAWASRYLGDNLLAGLPERQRTGWIVPLYLRSTKARVAQVDLDADGEILSEVVTLQSVIGTQA